MSEPVHSETPSVSGIAAAKTDLILNSSSDTIGDLFFVCHPEKALCNMWKKDAIACKPTVNVFRMDKDYIYTMSKSKPSWSNIDLYSSLEEVYSSDTVVYETEKCNQDISTNSYQLREQKKPSKVTKSVNIRTGREINYKESSDSDSDYLFKPKTKKDWNLGLKQPSENRIRAQDLILAHRKQTINSDQPEFANADTNDDIMGINTSNTAYPNRFEQKKSENLLHAMSGSNMVDPVNGRGINIQPSTNSSVDVDVSGINDSNTTDIKTPSVTSPTTSSMKQPPVSIPVSYHKRKPKPTGKHHRPAPLPDPPSSDDESIKQSVTSSKKPEFVTQQFGIIKRKKKRKISCPLCKHPAYSQAEANLHYRTTHPPLKCSRCDQMFNNPCSLRRHFYSHTKEELHTCRNCGCNFAFESNLSAHRLKYRCHPGFMCISDINGKVCGKWFFAKSDLTKHALTHSGKIHRCMECDFTTLDKRYLKAHIYTHSDRMKYSCSKCKELFKHHTQLLRHRVKCT